MRLHEVEELRAYHRRRGNQEQSLALPNAHPKAAERHRELHRLHQLMLSDLDVSFVEPCFVAAAAAVPLPAAQVPMKILLVDDCAMIQAIVRMSLPDADVVDLHCCGTARDAVAALRADYRDIDVVLLDMMLPDATGLDVMRQIRTFTRSVPIPIILFTATTDEQEIAEYRAAGVIGVIRKPFDPLGLHDQVRQMLNDVAERPELIHTVD